MVVDSLKAEEAVVVDNSNVEEVEGSSLVANVVEDNLVAHLDGLYDSRQIELRLGF